jgi:hypothetical protein
MPGESRPVADLFTSSVVELHRPESDAVRVGGALLDREGNLLADVGEPGLTSGRAWWRALVVWFAYQKRGTQVLRHHLELRGADGELLMSFVKERDRPFVRRPVAVTGPGGRPMGTATGPWSASFVGLRFRLTGPDGRPLGEMRRSGLLALRYRATDATGTEIALFGPGPRIGVATLSFDRSPSVELRALLLASAVILHLAR